MKEKKEKYSLEYPSSLKMSKRIWTIQEGDILRKEGKEYKVVQVVRPKIVGGRPKIVIIEVPQGEKGEI